MAKGKCPKGFICSDNSTLWLVFFMVVALVVIFSKLHMQQGPAPAPSPSPSPAPAPIQKIYMMQPPNQVQLPEPLQRYPNRGAPVQIGILTAEGGSSSSAAPDRTILPLFGRELDSRRSRWNYYTRTDGTNPVQVPVRVGNRVCDDDTNGCNEVYSDDSVHVPALGRSFKATVYRKSLF